MASSSSRFRILVILSLHFVVVFVESKDLTKPMPVLRSHKNFDVEAFGAVGNGLEDDTQAFARAWEAACKGPSGILRAPRGKTFLLNHSIFRGPCAANFTFQVDGTLMAPKHPSRWTSSKVWLEFRQLKQFALTGRGMILAKGNNWWRLSCKMINNRRICGPSPIAVQFEASTEVTVTGLTIVDSPHFHLHFLQCDNVRAFSVKVVAPKTSPNTDGIHIEASTNVLISDSVIGSGDDCISVGNGSSNITIKDLTCGPGHGISVGSLGKRNSGGDVSNVLVDGAKLIATDNGLRIKTWQGGSGLASNIVFQNVQMVDAANPIIIDQYYCDSAEPCRNQTSAVKISDVRFKDISGTSSTQVAVRFACSKQIPCTEILLSDISLTLSSGAEASSFCHNAVGQTKGTIKPPSCLL